MQIVYDAKGRLLKMQGVPQRKLNDLDELVKLLKKRREELKKKQGGELRKKQGEELMKKQEDGSKPKKID